MPVLRRVAAGVRLRSYGADLKRRVADIVTGRVLLRMTWPKKILLVAAAVCVVAAPGVLGQAKAAQRLMLAAMKVAPKPVQAAEAAPVPSNTAFDPCATPNGATFDVVSIKPSKASKGDWDSDSSGDGVSLSGTTRALIAYSFGLRDFQVIGGPDWIGSDTYDIKAKFDVPEKPGSREASRAVSERWKQRYRSLLGEHFQFRCHMATKELPVYDLVVAKGGIKMKPTRAEGDGQSTDGKGDGHKTQVVASGVSSEHLTATLAGYVGRTVIDKTGLKGRYDFTLTWSTQKQAERSVADGEATPYPELPTALEEQVGLKLVASKGPVPVLVIDRIEKPTVDGAEVPPQASGPQSQSTDVTAATQAAYVPTMTFDVASVRESKRDPSGWTRVGGGFEPLNSGHLRLENFSFLNLITMAYPIEYNQIEGLPRNLGWTMFNVEAKADLAADDRLAKMTKEQVRAEQQHMMQALLAERFHLKVHWETRDAKTYDLVVSKLGRLRTTGDAPSDTLVKAFGDRPIPPVLQQGGSARGFEYFGYGATAGDIAEMLTGQFGRPVNDKTGLSGKYYFHLKTWQIRASDRKDDETNPWPPLESAIQDDLGLKLVASHGPVQYLVIDHIEMPTEN